MLRSDQDYGNNAELFCMQPHFYCLQQVKGPCPAIIVHGQTKHLAVQGPTKSSINDNWCEFALPPKETGQHHRIFLNSGQVHCEALFCLAIFSTQKDYSFRRVPKFLRANYLCGMRGVCVCVVEIILISHYAMHLLCMVDAYWDTSTPEMLQKYIGDTSTRWWLLSLKKSGVWT